MKQSIAALALVGFVATASTAVAKPPANTAQVSESTTAQGDDASQRFQRGVKLYRERSFDAALAEFNRAYELAPNFRVLYNIGQVHAERGDYVAAVKNFRQYLTDGADAVGEGRASEVESEISRLEARIAKVRVVCNVDGAEVLVDGEPVGVLPLAAVSVNAGTRRIGVRKKGFEPQEVRLMLTGGEEKPVELKLQSENGAFAAPTTAPTSRSQSSDESKPGAEPGSRLGTAFWVSASATAVAGGATVAFALLTQNAKSKFSDELDRYPGSASRIDDARGDMKRFALVTDAFGALTLIGLGTTIYFAATGGTSTPKDNKLSRVTLQTGPTSAGRGGLMLQIGSQF